MRKVRKAIDTVDRLVTNILPPPQSDSETQQQKKKSINKRLRGEIYPLPVQRKQPVGKKSSTKKAMQKLNVPASNKPIISMPSKKLPTTLPILPTKTTTKGKR